MGDSVWGGLSLSWSQRRIERVKLLNNAKSYLEIGVEKGRTFLDVNIDFKDGVDPNFLFDTAAVVTDKIRLFAQTSDAFWTSGHGTIYDVIMIDGLHTFEQTFRDVLASLRYAHPRTVWLIDDTLPDDVFSAIPDGVRAIQERRKMNIAGNAWHGDAFKVVPAIHDFIPTMDYVTIVNSGNPQTLAWFGNRIDFTPLANNLETISRMTYFDIEPNIDLFRLVDENEAFERLTAAFNV
jgi:hypothetical protein